jgi:putative radical SAM enzyme (TIGR03279 family)
MVRIGEVAPGTIADELSLEIGSRIVRINGTPVRDSIDFRFLESDGSLELEVVAPGDAVAVVYEIEKEAGEALGIVPEPDTVRQCANKCVFCFIDGNPRGARQRLFLKDDDFRLSFSYGNYVTLTNLGPRGVQRLIEQRLSPLYVSVHATEPAVRERLLGVPMGGDIVARLHELVGQGIEVHTQVVLCPGWNDDAHLDRTLDDLWDLGRGVLSVSVVPVGLTRYNLNRPVRLLEPAEALQAVRQVQRARSRAARRRGSGWAYAADELFFTAGLPLPDAAYYDDWPLTENGVGAVRRFLDRFDAGLEGLGRLHAARIAILTGTRMAPLLRGLAPRLRQVTGAAFDVVAVANSMFGETVTTAGLLPGHALLEALQSAIGVEAALLPAEALNDDGVFIDDLSLDELRRRVDDIELRPGHELTAALAGL